MKVEIYCAYHNYIIETIIPVHCGGSRHGCDTEDGNGVFFMIVGD